MACWRGEQPRAIDLCWQILDVNLVAHPAPVNGSQQISMPDTVIIARSASLPASFGSHSPFNPNAVATNAFIFNCLPLHSAKRGTGSNPGWLLEFCFDFLSSIEFGHGTKFLCLIPTWTIAGVAMHRWTHMLIKSTQIKIAAAACNYTRFAGLQAKRLTSWELTKVYAPSASKQRRWCSRSASFQWMRHRAKPACAYEKWVYTGAEFIAGIGSDRL